MLVQTWTGQQKGHGSSAKQHLFVMPSRWGNCADKDETPIWDAPKVLQGYEKLQAQKHMASPGYIEEFGFWMQSTYQMPNETMLKLFGYVNHESGETRMASLMLFARNDAAIQRITMGLPSHPDYAFMELVTEIRADIITLDEAKEEGVRVNPMYRRHFTNSAVEDVFKIEQVAPATLPRPRIAEREVATVDGPARVRSRVRNRRLEL